MRQLRNNNDWINALFLGSIFIIATSCKKDGCTDVEALNYNPKAKNENFSCMYSYHTVKDSLFCPVYGAGTATLIHMIHKDLVESNKMGTYYYKNYNFYATFSSSSDQSFLLTGGVKMAYKHDPGGDIYMNFGKSVNNIYAVYSILDFKMMQALNTSINWIGIGDQWPAFSLTTTPDYPYYPAPTISNPKMGEAYTLVINGLSTTDSLLCEIYGQKNKISVTKTGAEPFVSYSKEEINKLGRGTALVKVIALNYEQQIIDGKTYNIVYGRDFKEETEVLK